MNFLQKNARWIAAVTGCVGGALRMWTLSAGEDEKALYPSAHPGWIGYLVLSAGAILLFLRISRKEPADQSAKSPLLPRVAQGLGALGIGLYAFAHWGRGDLLSTIPSVLGLVTALALIPHPKANRGFAHALSCIFFILVMFRINLTYGGEPELLRFLPQFFASLAAAMACYRQWGKAVELDALGKRLFWQLSGGYLCIAAAPGGHLMYLLVGLWLLIGSDVPAYPCQDDPAA